MTKKVNKLSDLEIDEVSLVDRGANQHASVEIFKNYDEGDEQEDDEEEEDEMPDDKETESVGKSFFSKLVSKVLSTDLTTSDKGDGTMSPIDKMTPGMQMPYGQMPQGQPAPGVQNMAPAGAQAFPADPNMGQAPGDIQAGPPIPDEVLDYIQQLEEALAQAQGEGQGQEGGDANNFQQEEEKMVGKNYDEDEAAFLQELAKSLQDEEQRDQIAKAEQLIKKANDRAEEAERIAKSERDHRLNQEFIAKARSFSNLPLSADEFGPVLKRLHDAMSEEDVAVIEKALSTANESVASYFDEIGKRGDNVLIDDRVDVIAKSMTEADPGLTMEQARSRALEQNPSLYDEILNDQGR